MRKLLQGIVAFRRNVRPDYRETFARLALGQSPDTLLIACSDSRVVPNLFASADPGDLFVVRNVGNLVAPGGSEGISVRETSELAALEFAIQNLKVSDIIVCGHSECGAMATVMEGIQRVDPVHLRSWLEHGVPALERLRQDGALDTRLSKANQLSQVNVLQQLDHLRTYPMIREREAAGRLRLHAWWFDIGQADVYSFEPADRRFRLLDETYADQLLRRYFP